MIRSGTVRSAIVSCRGSTPTGCGLQLRCLCSHPMCRCCSWARNTQRAPRFPFSSTIRTPSCCARCAKDVRPRCAGSGWTPSPWTRATRKRSSSHASISAFATLATTRACGRRTAVCSELRRIHPAFGRAGREGNFADVPGPGLLRMMRRGPEADTVAAFFNFGEEPAQFTLPAPRADVWRKVTDSASVALGGDGQVLREEAAGGVTMTLGRAAFVGYGS